MKGIIILASIVIQQVLVKAVLHAGCSGTQQARTAADHRELVGKIVSKAIIEFLRKRKHWKV